MVKQPARNFNFLLNAVEQTQSIDDISFDVSQELPNVTSFADAGNRRLAANHDAKASINGTADFATGQSDATWFGLIGSAGQSADFSPTGQVAGPNDPHYTLTSMVLESYSLKASTGAATKYSTALAANAAVVRAVA